MRRKAGFGFLSEVPNGLGLVLVLVLVQPCGSLREILLEGGV